MPVTPLPAPSLSAQAAAPLADRRALDFTSEFLAQQGLTLDDVLREVDVRPGEVLAVVGSVADGLANRLSDLDFLLIGSRRQAGHMIFRQDGQESIVFRINNDLEVNIDYIDIDDLDALASAVRSALRPDPEDGPVQNQLTDSQVTLLHRIRSGGAVYGDLEPWRAKLKTKYLPDYMIVSNLILNYVHREDAIGELAAGDDENAVYVMAYAMGFLATLLLAHAGETNNKRWWKWKLLRRVGDVVQPGVVTRLQRYMLPPMDADARTLVLEASQFCDEVIENCLVARPHLAQTVDAFIDRVKFVTDLARVEEQ